MANWQVISLDTVTPQLRAPGTGDGYSFNSGSTQLGVWTTTGLGIGTASPGTKLDVSGIIRTSTTGAAAQVYIAAPTAYEGSIAWQEQGVRNNGALGFPAGSDVLTYRAGSLTAGSGGTLGFVCTAAGNFGIGTTSASYKLTTNYTAPATFTNAAGDFNQMWQATGTNALGVALSTGDTTARFVVNNSYAFAWNNAASELMRLTSAGNLLVGGTSGSEALELTRSGSASAGIVLNQTGTSGRKYIISSTGTGYGSAGNLIFYDATAAAERARITSAGVFQIANGGALNLATTASGNGNISFDGFTFTIVSNSSTASLVFSTYSTERARIPAAGGMVVGTAALATNATDGFLYIPGCAGTPTGTPTAYTGRVPLVVDTTNNKLYFYSGGAWRDAGP